jgi:hypothetical protein
MSIRLFSNNSCTWADNGSKTEEGQRRKKRQERKRRHTPAETIDDAKAPGAVVALLLWLLGDWLYSYRLTRKKDRQEFRRDPAHRGAAGWRLG